MSKVHIFLTPFLLFNEKRVNIYTFLLTVSNLCTIMFFVRKTQHIVNKKLNL
nr:MAG TPA: hypothetical protein [Caudoviricetes sp.]